MTVPGNQHAEDLRRAFETSFDGDIYDLTRCTICQDEYADSATNDAWLGYRVGRAAAEKAERKRCATMREAIEAAVKAVDMGFMPNEILDENSPIMQAFRYAIRAGEAKEPKASALGSNPSSTAAQPPAISGDPAEPRDDSDRTYGRPIGYLPASELGRLHAGHDATLRSAKFGPSTLDGDVPVYLDAALAAAPKAAPAPSAQGDALPREDFAWMVVQEACETEPADEDDPECIRILRRDLKSAVLAAFLREDAARAAKEGAKHG